VSDESENCNKKDKDYEKIFDASDGVAEKRSNSHKE